MECLLFMVENLGMETLRLSDLIEIHGQIGIPVMLK
jgi:hypothetical protein